MAIRFRCPRCLHKLQTDDALAGRTFNCPHCGRKMSIPAAPAVGAVEEEDDPDAMHVGGEQRAASADAAAPRHEKPAERAVVPEKPPASKRRVAAATHREEAEAPLLAPSLKIDFEELIDMTAMVDIVFFLLIFFLVTSMHPLDSTIPLPTADAQGGSGGSSQTDASEGSIVVNIDRNDKILIDGTEVHGHEDLLLKLRDLVRGAGKPEKMLVIGSSEASHGTAVMVLDSGHEVGLAHVQMAVRDEK